MDFIYDYVNILAFLHLLRYENRRECELSKIEEYRQNLLNSFIEEDDIEEDGSFDILEIDPFAQRSIDDFIDIYHDYFSFDDNSNKVILNMNVTYKKLEELEVDIRNEWNIPARLISMSDEAEFLHSLDIYTIESVINELVKLEEMIENAYYQLYSNNDNQVLRNKLNKLLNIRGLFYVNLALKGEETLSAYRSLSMELSTQQTEYECFPMDSDLLCEYFDLDDYYDEEDFDIQDIMYDLYQYAIFGQKENFLRTEKVIEDIQNFQLEDSLLILGIENWIFYLNYINNINEYMNVYGLDPELLDSKRRLLYALDGSKHKLFDEKNFDKSLQETKKITLLGDVFDDIYDELFYLADEVFMTSTDNSTIKKLLLIRTYYRLTNDEDIKQVFMEHEDDPRYKSFFKVAFAKYKVNDKNDNNKKYMKKL